MNFIQEKFQFRPPSRKSNFIEENFNTDEIYEEKLNKFSKNFKRNLNKLTDELKDTKPSPKNGLKLMLTLILAMLVVGI